MGDIMLDNKIFSKVYLWMFLGLMVTFGTAYYVALHPNMVYNIFGEYYWLLFIAEIVIVIVLSARIAKLKPTTAKILFFLYSFITGLTFSTIFLVYNISSIIFVFLATSLLFLILALIGYYTSIDLTKFGTYLFIALLGIIILEIINIFVASSTLNMGLCVFGLVLFIGYVAYDIQIIKNNLHYLPEDNLAIFGALQLYLDFINIFIRLLSIFGKSDN